MFNFGEILSIKRSDQGNGWGVFNTEGGLVTGVCHTARIGAILHAEGGHYNHPIYGQQFKASRINIVLPKNADGIEKYLANAKIPGFGKVAAKKLVDYYEDETLDHVMDEKALKQAGLSNKQIDGVIAFFDTRKNHLSFIELLAGADIKGKTAENIMANATIEEVKENPYQLRGKVPRVTLSNCDAIWVYLNGDSRNADRVKAHIMDVMRRANDRGDSGIVLEGSVGYYNLTLIEGAAKSLGVDPEFVEDFLSENDMPLRIYPEGGDIVYTESTYNHEKFIASSLLSNDLPALTEPADLSGMKTLSGEQLQAVEYASKYPVSIVTGAPGTGKTHIIEAICCLATANGLEPVLLAPTGLAARRMQGAGKHEASTIHSFLATKQTFDDVLFIVDEVSMVSLDLMSELLKVIDGHRLVLVGDVDQLPSIEHGQTLYDLIESSVLPVTRLTFNYRSKDSDIIKTALQVLTGENPSLTSDLSRDVCFVQCDDGKVTSIINELVGVSDQVLAPKKKGVAGVGVLNDLLAEKFNPGKDRKRLGFAKGDRVINGKNDRHLNVMNGETGEVIEITDKTVTVNYGGVPVTHEINSVNFKLSLAYALTVHKVQGQEYERVIIAIPKEANIMLSRNLYYTAITRAKKQVVLVGNPEALKIVLSGRCDSHRITGLRHHLKEYAKSS